MEQRTLKRLRKCIFVALQEAGTVLHLARSGRLILKTAGQPPREGSILVDEKGRRTCKVLEIIGPVSSSYISAQPLTDRIERVAGTKLFVEENAPRDNNRRFFDRKAGSKPRDRNRGRNYSRN
jgi:rRNA processing protein Gar1